jgi:uncharacterized DUF497 family protein
MAISREWDPKKAARNLRKHQVSFEEARTVFDDPLHSTSEDLSHSTPTEQRLVTIGQSDRGKTLVVIHTQEADTIRIIRAREATPFERETYEEG